MAIFQRYITIDVTPTIGTDAYTDGDVIGGLLTFAIPGANGSGIINRVVLVDDGNQDEPLDLFLFDDTPATIADDAAYAPTAADHAKIIGKVSIAAADYWSENSLSVAEKNDLNHTFEANAQSNIYGYLVANGGTPDYAAAADLTIRLGVATEG